MGDYNADDDDSDDDDDNELWIIIILFYLPGDERGVPWCHSWCVSAHWVERKVGHDEMWSDRNDDDEDEDDHDDHDGDDDAGTYLGMWGMLVLWWTT